MAGVYRALHRKALFGLVFRLAGITGSLPWSLACLGEGIAVIAFIGQQIIGVDAFDQAACLCAIRPGIFCNNNSDRQTLRIHGQMYFRVEPPLHAHRLISAFGSAAWGGLQPLASIISHSSSGSSIRMFSSFSQIPASRHPDKTAVRVAPPAQIWWQIAPRRARAKIQKTALMNKRLSFATPPYYALATRKMRLQ